MTICDVARQLYNLSNGNVNRETFTRKQLQDYIYKLTDINKPFVIEVGLRDDWWYCEIVRRNYSADSWDYFLPDTREQSDAIFKRLIERNK